MEHRIYLQVEVQFLPDGRMLPSQVIWTDGRRFAVERVLDVRPGALSAEENAGDRYTVRVRGHVTRIWFERSTACGGTRLGRWFVRSRPEDEAALELRLRENLHTMGQRAQL